MGIVAFAYILRQALDYLPRSRPFNGSFTLSVVIPVVIWLWYKKNPGFFQKQEKTAIMLLCYLLIVILITPLLGS